MASTGYRDNGAVGALLDEYEKAIAELKALVSTVTTDELVAIVDPLTKDADCRSIQSILTHVIGSGYYYAIATRNHFGDQIAHREKVIKSKVEEYLSDLDLMFQYNVAVFESHPELQIEDHKPESKILTRWGQRYDAEQMYEHAIIHILRHRRQIERFLIKLRIT